MPPESKAAAFVACIDVCTGLALGLAEMVGTAHFGICFVFEHIQGGD